ncbi:MAG TPA: hypothetical protein VLH84_00530 [Patescibacteria group bacterium]|nr:hypothetical protein [Patescibacteria group bacterium]
MERRPNTNLRNPEHTRQSRAGMFLYLLFVDLGVRAAANVAASMENSPLKRRLSLQHMMGNWRSARKRMERNLVRPW